MRITTAQRTANENRIRAAIDRLLRGEIPPGGRCDIKALAADAGVDRTAFYGTAPTHTSASSSNDACKPYTRPASGPTRATPRSPASKTRSPR